MVDIQSMDFQSLSNDILPKPMVVAIYIVAIKDVIQQWMYD